MSIAPAPRPLGDDFEERNRVTIEAMAHDPELRSATQQWFEVSARHEYSYHFSWMGRPIIQYPQDMVAMQEIIWRVKPQLIVETGIARGGSLVYYASLLELLGGDGLVVGIDIDLREHNRRALETHPMYKRLRILDGSSVDPKIVAAVHDLARNRQPVLVTLDSNHTHEHVLAELEAYADLVPRGSYLVVFDTAIEDMPADAFPNRPWSKGNNAKTAVHEFLERNPRFVVDYEIENKLQITVAPDGYLKCIADLSE